MLVRNVLIKSFNCRGKYIPKNQLKKNIYPSVKSNNQISLNKLWNTLNLAMKIQIKRLSSSCFYAGSYKVHNSKLGSQKMQTYITLFLCLATLNGAISGLNLYNILFILRYLIGIEKKLFSLNDNNFNDSFQTRFPNHGE